MAVRNPLMFFFLSASVFLQAADGPIIYGIQTVAGSDSNGDGGPAMNALLSQAEGIAVDRQGNIYIADAADNRIRKITPDGTIQTIAGTGIAGFAGDGGLASKALLNQPYGVAVDSSGNLFVADLGNARVRKISLDGTIQTVAGGGSTVAAGNVSGPAVNVQLLEPRNVAVDTGGWLYISDFAAHTVYKVSPSGVLSTLAGNGNAGFNGDGSSAILGQLKAPAGLAVDAGGAVYIADSGNNRIRKVSNGVISTFYSVASPTGVAINSAGTLYIASAGYFGTQSEGIGGLTPCMDVAIDGLGNVYVTEGQFVREVTTGGATLLIAGTGASRYFGGDGGEAAGARFNAPSGIALDSAGNWYIADSANNRIRQIASTGIVTTYAGTSTAGFAGDNGQATLAELSGPLSVAVDSLQNVYVADSGNNALRKITPGGVISTVSNQLNAPSYVAVAPDQSVYVADTGNNRVVRFAVSGDLQTVTQIVAPRAVVLDQQGNLFVSGQSSVLKISPAGTLSTVLDGLNAPRGLAITPHGDLLIAETGANVIRRVSSSGVATVIAGDGVAGFSGDGGTATAAQLNTPEDLALDSAGVVWIADSANNRVRSLRPVTGPASDLAAMTLLNAASMASGAVAPEEIVTIFGVGFVAGQTQLLFDGQPATIFYTGANQINALAPAQFTSASSTEVSIAVNGLKIADWNSPVAAAAPGIFTIANGTGQAAANNQDGSINSASNPAARGSIITLYATGQGDGTGLASLTIGDFQAQLLYAGPAPGFPGLMQINALIPGGFLGPGIQPVVLSVGNAASQIGVTVAIR
ncbi:MAG TPA: IPT/TIG domain-containing protein [Bryobacteraceae bacterium]|nr:IPT/TIG domain-containing protein [Bryobacteraceae bacterium]